MSSLAKDLHRHRAHRYSQNDEDGALARLLEVVGVTNRFYVEFGVGSGEECNTRLLRENGWRGVMMDYACEDPSLPLYREFITAENINELFARYGVPDSFDVLSVDIDGNDYWVWKAIAPRYRPRVVVIEYNRAVPVELAVTMPYDPAFRWAAQPNAGQSLLAVKKLGWSKGYSLVYAEPPNAFLALTSILPPSYREVSAAAAGRITWRENRELRREWKESLEQLPWVHV